MLTLNPSSLRTTLGDVVANAAGGGSPPASSSADPAGFASLLRQTQMAPPPVVALAAPAPAPTAAAPKPAAGQGATTDPVSPRESPDEAPASPESDTTQRARALLKGKLRAVDGNPVAPRDEKPTPATRDSTTVVAADKTDKPDTADCKAPETQLTGGTTSTDPNVMQWLAGLQRAAASQTAEPRTAADGKTALSDTGVVDARAAKGPFAADQKTDAMPVKAPPAETLVGSSSFAAALVGQGEIVEKPQYKVIDGIKDLAAAGAGALAPAPAGATDAAPPVAVAITAPVSAPDFAQELGLRLSTLAKDGVQTAELHLNPADMGPVSVQIVMDGTQARIDFGADLATTRHAIEAGLPELAGALADAGFTLAGGGVSQHAGGRGDGNGSGASNRDDPRRIVVADQTERVATAARRIVTKGGIDLFA